MAVVVNVIFCTQEHGLEDDAGGSPVENLMAQAITSRKHLLSEKLTTHCKVGLARQPVLQSEFRIVSHTLCHVYE